MAHYPSRTPKQFEPLLCRGEKKPDEWHLLTYSHDRGFFEPITNEAAEPVIGKIVEWHYERGAE